MPGPIRHARGTRAAFTSLVGSSSLVAGQVYLITDESRLVVALTSSTFSDMALKSETTSPTVTNNVTAGTNTQGQGALTSDYNIVTTAASNPSGVTLPTATSGRSITIVNKGANPVNVYPATGATIDTEAVDTPIVVQLNECRDFNASSTTQWYSDEPEVIFLGDNVLYSTTSPSTPSEGVAIFGVQRANRRMIGYKTVNGRTERIGSWMGSNNTVLCQANYNLVTVTSVGAALSIVTAANTQPFATTNFLTQQRRNRQTIATIAGMLEQWGPLMASRLPGNGGGGFHISWRFGIVALNTDAKLFCGLTSAAAAMTNVNPSTLFNLVGLGKDSDDTTTLALFSNGGSGTAQKVTLTNTGTMTGIDNTTWQVELFCSASDTVFGYRVTERPLPVLKLLMRGLSQVLRMRRAVFPQTPLPFLPIYGWVILLQSH